MDSITHIVLGATIGELMAGRRLGKKAMLLGAVAQSLPDIDFLASFWMDTSHDVLAHRGFTHSILFVLILTPLLAWAARRKWRRDDLRVKDWILFFGVQLFVHIFLDAFNAYGTGWFEPFSHYRVSFQALFVADPFYSVWLGISFVALLILKTESGARRSWARFGLTASTLYLCYCVTNKWKIDAQVKKELERRDLAYTRYLTTPTPLNSWLWYIVVENETGYLIGYRSLFDRDPRIDFHFFPRRDSLLRSPRHRKDMRDSGDLRESRDMGDSVDLRHREDLRDHGLLRDREDVRELVRFSQGYYTLDRWEGGKLVFNDLRFGQMKGWEDPDARFVFHYFLERTEDNGVIVQRGRFHGWDMAAIRAFVRRVRGD